MIPIENYIPAEHYKELEDDNKRLRETAVELVRQLREALSMADKDFSLVRFSHPHLWFGKETIEAMRAAYASADAFLAAASQERLG
jgi:hypothetical protein